MGRPIHRLTARAVATATRKGYHPDGGGLYLQVSATGTKSWVLRYKVMGKARDMGLGSAAVVTLQEARHAALEAKKALVAGKDPIRQRRAAQAQGMTFGEAADAYIESHKAAWKNEAQADQWTQSLKDHGPNRDLPVAEVDTAEVVRCLRKIWSEKTETATRVRGRIERILDWARVTGLRDGDNPARWRGHLDKLLPRPQKLAKVRHHAAMPYRELPTFWARLNERDGLARRALKFTILTAARTGETTGAPWDEFDLKHAIWSIPGSRMKAGVQHRVPLVPEAVDLLKKMPKTAPPFPLSENGMLNLLQKHMKAPYTVHGFRSSFRDWAAEETDFPGEVVEMALAHAIENKVEAAYRRGDLLEKRRELMRDWAAFLTSSASHATGR